MGSIFRALSGKGGQKQQLEIADFSGDLHLVLRSRVCVAFFAQDLCFEPAAVACRHDRSELRLEVSQW